MNTIKINKGKTLMVGHRGVCGLEPENTLSSFVAGCNRTYYGIESDVHVTLDGKFVIIHDSQTGRVAGDDINIEQSSYELIRKIRLFNANRSTVLEEAGLKDRGDLIIPSLEEYIAVCKKYEKKCVLELKNPFEKENIEKLISEIKKLDYLENIIFISFDFENMVKLRELLPKQPLQFLTCSYDSEILEKLNKYNLDIDIGYKALTKEIVDEIHSNNHLVNCWTCNTSDDAEKLVEMGVDFITSDILE